MYAAAARRTQRETARGVRPYFSRGGNDVFACCLFSFEASEHDMEVENHMYTTGHNDGLLSAQHFRQSLVYAIASAVT